ncbi:MAG: hypothetical protein CR982_09140 [Candidatus Cloacimonadota bacterium]|nr:MAG: hypothetical protein CR982_09140 [Candidatus Cloacimonadota bacterium]PIE78631.1 MAG: hypothetical protein CSA15_07035 [Candidatus Delongbacteria bacterium]
MEDKIVKAKREYEESLKHISENDLESTISQTEYKVSKLEGSIPDTLKEVWRDIILLLFIVKDYYKGNYKAIPIGSVIAASAALLYFASPFDIIPDFIPFSGFIDDVAVVSFALKMIKSDIESYKKWRKEDRRSKDKYVYGD